MVDDAVPSIEMNHPAPQRHRAGLAALLFGICAAPVAWNVQLLLSTALSGHDCYPREHLLAAPLWNGLSPVLLAISVAGIAMAIAGGVVSWRSWRRTYDESPGSVHHLVDRGEGRTRFMAMCGILTSALFLVALVFGTIAFYLVPLCGN